MMASHDQHFLERLERLEREHVELALGLYYDQELVQHILRAADIPDHADRVALCLGKPEAGPHVIVARDGHFVTCLGEGMQLREGQPVISRPRLDKISETVESLRSLVADASTGNQGRIQRRLARMLDAGAGLSREEFEDLARWLPLMRGRFLLLHMDIVDRTHDLVDRLARVKHWNRRSDELLHHYYGSAWAIAHLTTLLGSDDEILRRVFELLEADIPGAALQLPWSLTRFGVMSFALRGAWAASKLPALVVPAAKRRYLEPEATFFTTLTDAQSMIAVGLRHRRYQGEIRKVLARGELAPEAITSRPELIRMIAARSFETSLADQDACYEHIRLQSRELVRALFPEDAQALVDAIPDEVPLALIASIPTPLQDDMQALPVLFGRLPWVARVDASAFYLPEEYCNFVRGPWTRDEGLAMLRPRLTAGAPPRPRPVIAAPTIPRNGPCPCGSARKYKKCCGAPGQ